MPGGIDYISITLYWILVAIWSVVVLIFLSKYDQPKGEEPKINFFLRLLLIFGFAILVIDSIYFSTLFRLPEESALLFLFQTILQSRFLLIPKVGLLLGAIVLIYLVWRRGMQEMEEETRNMQKISTLNAVAATVSRSLDLEEILNETLDKVLEVMGAESGEIVLLDEDEVQPDQTLSRGSPPAFWQDNWGVVEEVLETEEALVTEDFSIDGHSPNGPAERERFQTVTSVPLASKHKILGIMNIYGHNQGGITERDVELLTSIGNQVGVAVENARLFNDLDEAYRELATTQAQLFQSEKLAAVGELAAGIAHEIANPLSTVIGDSQLLLRDLEPDHPGFESAKAIERSGRRAQKVIRNLLDFSRQQEYELVPTDVNDTIEKALSLMAHQIQGENISIVRELVPDLPLTIASPYHLEEVWINLLINARDAIPKGEEGEIRIATRSVPEKDIVCVHVSDNGAGMPEERLEKIFEPFFTTKDLGQGTGLGLYICYNIIEKHNGRIDVESEVGEGTMFTVMLPTQDAETAPEATDGQQQLQRMRRPSVAG